MADATDLAARGPAGDPGTGATGAAGGDRQQESFFRTLVSTGSRIALMYFTYNYFFGKSPELYVFYKRQHFLIILCRRPTIEQ